MSGRRFGTYAILALVLVSIVAVRDLPRPRPTSAQSAASELALTSSPPAQEAADYPFYPVVKVVDGDTIVVARGGENTTLRLIGLDTPETVDPRKPVQCFGTEASRKAHELLDGTRVRIELDPSQGTLDKYGRTLAYVYMPDGTLFNELMIERGFGHEYTYNLPYKYQKDFKDAEKRAREAKRGLWADGACGSTASATSSAPAPAPQLASAAGGYDCSRNAYNCSSLKTQAEAQYVFELCGGDANDIHKLDRDGDGRVCESLP